MRLPRVIGVVLALVCLLIPTLGLGDGLPAPLEKKLPPGVSTFTYAGETLRISTPSALIVRCDPLSPTQIRVRVSVYSGVPQSPNEPAAPTATLNIYWVNHATDVYDGSVPPPGQSVDAVLTTEGGFVDR
jgi:hypothetical protein